jgi:adenosylmethionine---8-amino-7-oxononanoate aminotransferase
MGIMEENRELEDLDKKYIWHPFTQMKEWESEKPIIISEGKDCFIKDVYGRWYLDGVSSLWVNIFGHRNKDIDGAIKAQLEKISHSTLLGLSNVPAIKLAEKLTGIVNKSLIRTHQSKSSFTQDQEIKRYLSDKRKRKGLQKVFYSDNGSTAVEVALKMSFQYWQHKGIEGKHAFAALHNAYHGDTIGAVSVGGVDIFHKAFGPLLFKTYKAPSPSCYRCELDREYPDCKMACLEKLEEIFHDHSAEIAAFIIEPLIQAAGGMLTAPSGYLKGARELCTRYNIIMIADEIATGFGRTGKMFACEHEEVVPDIMCLSKGITGGYMPLSATLATEEIYQAFLGKFKDLKTFFHGHSYTGNPLACAAALACLDLFEKEKIVNNLKAKVEILELWFKDILNLRHVGDVRNAGMMAGVELVKDRKTKEPYDWNEKIGWKVAYHARDNGVFIRPLGNVIVIMPPLVISDKNLKQLLNVLKDSIIEVTEKR